MNAAIVHNPRARVELPGLAVRDHLFTVPVDYARPEAASLELFAREVAAIEAAESDRPWLVFLQGGPGFGAPRPIYRSGWLGRAVEHYRVLLLDPRGAGRSSRVDAASLACVGSVDAQAEYLSHFRADGIVRDCEAVRRSLCGDRPWTVLGQSFGGFCAFTYLSFHPEGLAAAIVTGGIPPIGVEPEDIYRATYPRVLAQNRRYFARYPADRGRLDALAALLEANEVRSLGGDRLSARRVAQIGLHFGFDDGLELAHYLLESATGPTPDGERPAYEFLAGLERLLPYATNPIFSLLHEAAYCEGRASNWAAERVRAEFPEFALEAPLLFTGEMMYPWMFEEYGQLRPHAELAGRLAARSDWGPLYDRDRLARNEVPVVAAVYSEDMFVERRFSERVAAEVPGVRTWLTNEFEHNGLRTHGQHVFTRLHEMLQGRC